MARTLDSEAYPMLTYFLGCYAADYTLTLEDNVRGFAIAEGSQAVTDLRRDIKNLVQADFPEQLLRDYFTALQWHYSRKSSSGMPLPYRLWLQEIEKLLDHA